MNSVCGLWTQNFWCCYQWSRRGIWCEHQMCYVYYKVLIQINGKWGRLISRIFMTSTFADVKIQSRFFVVLMFWDVLLHFFITSKLLSTTTYTTEICQEKTNIKVWINVVENTYFGFVQKIEEMQLKTSTLANNLFWIFLSAKVYMYD